MAQEDHIIGSHKRHSTLLYFQGSFYLIDKYALILTHKHLFSMCSPETNPGPFDFSSLQSPISKEAFSQRTTLQEKFPWTEPWEESTSLPHRDFSALNQLHQPLPPQALQHPPWPAFAQSAPVFLQCGLSVTSHLCFIYHHRHIDEQHQRTPHSQSLGSLTPIPFLSSEKCYGDGESLTLPPISRELSEDQSHDKESHIGP